MNHYYHLTKTFPLVVPGHLDTASMIFPLVLHEHLDTFLYHDLFHAYNLIRHPKDIF